MKLSELKNNETAYISTVGGSRAFHMRLGEMGFVPGQEVTRIYAAPLGNPIVFAMLGQKVALRRSEAELIGAEATEAKALEEAKKGSEMANTGGGDSIEVPVHAAQCEHAGSCCGSCPSCGTKQQKPKFSKETAGESTITIALVGNPNCGKTAFFNAASGGHERTGNYAGITVASVEGWTEFEGHRLRVIDLPGTYSLQAFSPEEAFVANRLAKGDVDVVINVLDVNNLERNLLLTLQLQKIGVPIVGALNMYDEFENSGSKLDIEELEKRSLTPMIPTVAKSGRGVKEVLHGAIVLAERKRDKEKSKPCEAALATDPHAAIHELLNGIYSLKEGRVAAVTRTLDKYLARTPLAFLLFFAIMGFIFYATFEIGAYPMDWMDAGVGWLIDTANSLLPAGWLRDLLVDGVLGGVGSVIVFLPNILILYFFISILEDSGYLARAALLADPLLKRVGHHGKSFIPMLMGFGCNVPAVMSTRTIESRKSRLITMMTLPFMSCSARLPIYIILTGAFFPDHAALVMMCLYIGGILVAFTAASIMNKVFHKTEESHFVMEMPPYRTPVMKGVLIHMWEKGRQYLRKMGGIILVASVVVWALGYFPHSSDPHISDSEQQEQSYLGRMGHAISPVIKPLGYDWRMGVGIVAGVGAKEVVVSTLGVLYNAESADNPDEEPNEQKLSASMRQSGITKPAALSYLVFALLYFPCLATIAAVKGESGRWKYAIFTAAYTTITAYVAAFIVYHLAMMFM